MNFPDLDELLIATGAPEAKNIRLFYCGIISLMPSAELNQIEKILFSHSDKTAVDERVVRGKECEKRDRIGGT
jgi:hypothetical protein